MSPANNRKTPRALRPVHERFNGKPFCGTTSLAMVDTQAVTCNDCLMLLREAIATELARVIGKLAVPRMGKGDRIRLEIHIDRADGEETTDPVVIVPDSF